MPNHITTILRIEGTDAQVSKVRDFIRGENSCIDFNRIVPIPETFRKYDTTNHPNGKHLEVGGLIRFMEPDSQVITQELIEEYKKATHEQALKYGVIGWYDWSRAFWGTKWNAYSTEELSDTTIKFNTAWSFPRPVIKALSEKFPKVELHYVFADEDASYNTGTGQVKNGKFIEEDYPDGNSAEGWHNFFYTHENEEQYYEEQENGRYIYKDE